MSLWQKIRPVFEIKVSLGDFFQILTNIYSILLTSGHLLQPFTWLDFLFCFPNTPSLVIAGLFFLLIFAIRYYRRFRSVRSAISILLLLINIIIVGLGYGQAPLVRQVLIRPVNDGIDSGAWNAFLNGLDRTVERFESAELHLVVQPSPAHSRTSFRLGDPLTEILGRPPQNTVIVHVRAADSNSPVYTDISWEEPARESDRLPVSAIENRTVSSVLTREQLSKDAPAAVVAFAGVNSAVVYYARSEFELANKLLMLLYRDQKGLRPCASEIPASYYLLAKLHLRGGVRPEQYLDLYESAAQLRGALQEGNDHNDDGRREATCVYSLTDHSGANASLNSVYQHLYLALIEWHLGNFSSALKHKDFARDDFDQLRSTPFCEGLPESQPSRVCRAVEDELALLDAQLGRRYPPDLQAEGQAELIPDGAVDPPDRGPAKFVSAESRYNLGLWYLKKHDVFGAERAFLEALRCDSNYQPARIALFNLYERVEYTTDLEQGYSLFKWYIEKKKQAIVARSVPRGIEPIFPNAVRYLSEENNPLGQVDEAVISENVRWMLEDRLISVKLVNTDGPFQGLDWDNPVRLEVAPDCLPHEDFMPKSFLFKRVSPHLMSASFYLDSQILDLIAREPTLSRQFFHCNDGTDFQLAVYCYLKLTPTTTTHVFRNGYLLVIAKPRLILMGEDTQQSQLAQPGISYRFTSRISATYMSNGAQREFFWDDDIVREFEFKPQIYRLDSNQQKPVDFDVVQGEFSDGRLHFKVEPILEAAQYRIELEARHPKDNHPEDWSYPLRGTLDFTVTETGLVDNDNH